MEQMGYDPLSRVPNRRIATENLPSVPSMSAQITTDTPESEPLGCQSTSAGASSVFDIAAAPRITDSSARYTDLRSSFEVVGVKERRMDTADPCVTESNAATSAPSIEVTLQHEELPYSLDLGIYHPPESPSILSQASSQEQPTNRELECENEAKEATFGSEKANQRRDVSGTPAHTPKRLRFDDTVYDLPMSPPSRLRKSASTVTTLVSVEVASLEIKANV